MTPGGCVSDASLLSVAISGYSHQKNSIRAYNASLYHQRVHGLVASSFTSFVYISPASSFLSKVSVMLKQNMSERRDKKKERETGFYNHIFSLLFHSLPTLLFLSVWKEKEHELDYLICSLSPPHHSSHFSTLHSIGVIHRKQHFFFQRCILK